MPLPAAWALLLQLTEWYWAPFGTFVFETHPDYLAVLWQPWRPLP